jgi:ABC-type sulfate transport system permease component
MGKVIEGGMIVENEVLSQHPFSVYSRTHPTVRNLRTLALVIVVISVIAAILCLAFLSTTVVIEDMYYSIGTKVVFSPLGIFCALGVLFEGAIMWCIISALARIMERQEQQNKPE